MCGIPISTAVTLHVETLSQKGYNRKFDATRMQ